MSHETDTLRQIISSEPNTAQWKAMAVAGNLSEAIKLVRIEHGLSLKYGKDVVEMFVNDLRSAGEDYITNVPLSNGGFIRVSKHPVTGMFMVQHVANEAQCETQDEVMNLVVKMTETASHMGLLSGRCL